MKAIGVYKNGQLIGFCTNREYAKGYAELFRYQLKEIKIDELPT